MKEVVGKYKKGNRGRKPEVGSANECSQHIEPGIRKIQSGPIDE
jgi:hypothetical protein